MKLATFLAPGASDPLAGEIRGEEVVAFEAGTVLVRQGAGLGIDIDEDKLRHYRHDG